MSYQREPVTYHTKHTLGYMTSFMIIKQVVLNQVENEIINSTKIQI